MPVIEKKIINLSKIGIINRQINSTMSLPDLLAVILEIATEIVSAEGASLLLCEPETGDLAFHIISGEKKEILRGEKVPQGKGIVGIVAKTLSPLIINDAQNDLRFFKEIDNKSNFVTRNILCVPMLVIGKLVGVLEAVNAVGRHEFNDSDLRLLSYIADQAAIAIHHRQLVDQLTSRVEELTALHEISQAVSFSKMDDSIFNIIIQAIAGSLNVDKCSLLLFDPGIGKLVIKACCGLPDAVSEGTVVDMKNSIAGHVFKTGEPLLVSDPEKDLPFNPDSHDRPYNTRSFISVPIRSKNTIFGVLNLTDKHDSSLFDQINLRAVSTVANYLAEVYMNLQYQRDFEMQKRLAQEIDIAAEIQKKILPKIPPFFNSTRLAAFNKPAKEVGGDFYDFFPFDQNKYSVLVADVSGKGIPSALFMGSSRNIIRAEMRMNNHPGTLLSHSNRYIFEDSEYGMFVTLFYALIDTHNRFITYGSAGHNDQLFIRRRDREVIKLNAQGIPLGLEQDLAYEEKILLYEPGDMLVLFTDGVLEYLGDKDIDAGESALIDLALQHLDSNPPSLITHLRNNLADNAVDSDFMDDFTVLSIQF